MVNLQVVSRRCFSLSDTKFFSAALFVEHFERLFLYVPNQTVLINYTSLAMFPTIFYGQNVPWKLFWSNEGINNNYLDNFGQLDLSVICWLDIVISRWKCLFFWSSLNVMAGILYKANPNLEPDFQKKWTLDLWKKRTLYKNSLWVKDSYLTNSSIQVSNMTIKVLAQK